MVLYLTNIKCIPTYILFHTIIRIKLPYLITLHFKVLLSTNAMTKYSVYNLSNYKITFVNK